jgi:hypothetical protein
MRLTVICAVTLLCWLDLHAQNNAPGLPNPPDAPGSTPEPAALPPLTLGGRFDDYLFRAYGPFTLLGAGFSAGVAQLRNYPSPWGRSDAAFGKRYASLAGRNAISETIQFGLGALDGEDPRYHASKRHGVWARGVDAAVQALVPYKMNGSRTFAYSRLAGWFGSGLISEYWYPHGTNTAGDGLARGATMIASDVGNNEFREFWPDVKRKFFHHKARSSKP